MALIPTQDVPLVGVDNVTFVAANGGGDTANAGSGVALIVRNTDAATKTVTVTTPNTVEGLAIADIVRVVPVTTGLSIIPLASRLVGAVASIAYSAVTNLSVGVVKLPR